MACGLRLGEDSVGVGLIGGREVGGGVGRRRGLAAWGLGQLGPVTLRSVVLTPHFATCI